MPKLVFTQADVDDAFKGKKCHHFKDRTIDMADDMAIHVDGKFPLKLIRQRRPNEPKEVLEYRELIWKPITKPTLSKVLSSLQKIRRSREWAIKYKNADQFSKISEDETLEKYCESNFPYFTNITNWVFSILLRKYIIDPNAVVFINPIEEIVPVNEFLRPFPEIFDSCFVIDYREEDYAILESPVPCTYYDGKEDRAGKTYYFVTTMAVFKYNQVDNELGFTLVSEIRHDLGILPVFKLGGILIAQAERQFLYESRIAAMLPELDEAAREYSDLQASKVLHIYLERWEFTGNECTECKGTGKRINPLWHDGCNCDAQIECHKCQGHGYSNAGPYAKIMIKPTDAMSPGTQIPNPPAGYIQKDVEVVKVQQEGVDGHIYKALAAINFEFLAQTPLNQSGTAKEVDKDELNNTVSSIAEDLVAIMDKIYKTIARFRYRDVYSPEDILLMLPDIPVPQVFDLLSAQHLGDELAESKKNNINPVILNAMEIDFANKRFNDQTIRDMVALTLQLDPLPNIAEADKVIMLQNEGITQLTYVISSNIQMFIQEAIEQDEAFVDKQISEQRTIIEKMAQDQIDAASKAKALVKSMFLENGGNGLNQNSNDGNIPGNTQNDSGGAGQVSPANTGASGANDGGAAAAASAA